MSNVRILDCTLRDGGFYTDWHFSAELVRDLVLGLDVAGVAMVELGYRSPNAGNGSGLFKYCDEKQLVKLLPERRRRVQYAFMLDAKEFIAGDQIDTSALAACVPPASSSLFTWARVATHLETIDQACSIAGWLKDRGFAVALNIMGASSTDPGLLARLAPAYRAPLDALVLADSCGSLTPDDTGELVRRVRARHSQVLGIHLHDNLGFALPNALAAIERGVEIVDSTVAGMGRGAGNLRTEQLLLTLCMKYGRHDLDPTPLLHVLSKHMMPLHRIYGWGSDFAYMLSGLAGIHPMYCQELKSSTRYGLDEVAQILEDLPRDKRARFDASELIAAEARHAARKHRGAERAR